MPKLAPTRPTGKRSKKPEANRATGWRSVEQDGLPAPGQYPVLVLREPGAPLLAWRADQLTRCWSCSLLRISAAIAIKQSDWWIPVERLAAMLRVIQRNQGRGLG